MKLLRTYMILENMRILKIKYANFAMLYLRNKLYTRANIFTGGLPHSKGSLRPQANEILGFPKRSQKRPLF